MPGFIDGLRLGNADRTALEDRTRKNEREDIELARKDEAYNYLNEKYGPAVGDAELATKVAGEVRAQTTADQKNTEFSQGQEDRTKGQGIEAMSRLLGGIKVARDKGIKPSEALGKYDRRALAALGIKEEMIGELGAELDADPSMIDQKIAMLKGAPTQKRVFKQEFAKGPGGVNGTLVTFDDGTTQFLDEYGEMPKATNTPGAKVINGLLVAPDGSVLGDYTGSAFNQAGQTAMGKVAGEARAEDLPWTQTQARDADAAYSIGLNKAQNLQKQIDLAISQVDWTSAGVAGQLKGVGGNPANLAGTLETIGANIGLDELLKLKAAGGTLGQVTEAEHRLLQSQLQNLSQIQDPAVLKRKLQELKVQAAQSWQRVQRVYQETKAARGSQPAAINAPAAATGGAAPDPETTTPAVVAAPARKASAKYY